MFRLTDRPRAGIAGLAFAPDGRRLYVAAASKARVWDVAAQRKLGATASGDPTAVVVSPCGRFVAVNEQRRLAVYSADLSEPPLFVVRQRWPDLGCGFTPDGLRLVAARIDTHTHWDWWEVETWAPAAGRFLPPSPIGDPPTDDYTLRFAIAPTGKTVATFGYGPVRLWDRPFERPRIVTGLPITGDLEAMFSPDSSKLVVWSRSKLYAIEAARGEVIADTGAGRHKHNAAAFTPDGQHLLTVSSDHTVRVFETAGWSLARTYDWDVGRLKALAIAPDGLTAACGGSGGHVVVWDLDL